jgi:hypothetical protein
MSSTDSDSRTICTQIQSKVWGTRIQAQCLLGLELKGVLGLELKGVIRLGYKHNVYSD